MPLDIRESMPLGRFVYEPAYTPLKGTYILPLRFFKVGQALDPNEYLEVLQVLDVGGTDVAITRGGGLFVRDKGQYKTRESHQQLVDTFNLLLAEFALQGLASHPVTYTEVQAGKLIGRFACIAGGGGRFGDRTWGPYTLLVAPTRDLGAPYGRPGNDYWPANFYWPNCDPSILDRITNAPNALHLRKISPSLPTLLVAAAYHATRHNVAEGTVTSWILCEELLSFLWDRHVDQISEKARKERLTDSRTYSAAVRLEVLLVAGVLPDTLCALLQEARRLRNALAHRSKMNMDAADICYRAMCEMLHHIGIGTELLPSYTCQDGGSLTPHVTLEPEFPFK